MNDFPWPTKQTWELYHRCLRNFLAIEHGWAASGYGRVFVRKLANVSLPYQGSATNTNHRLYYEYRRIPAMFVSVEPSSQHSPQTQPFDHRQCRRDGLRINVQHGFYDVADSVNGSSSFTLEWYQASTKICHKLCVVVAYSWGCSVKTVHPACNDVVPPRTEYIMHYEYITFSPVTSVPHARKIIWSRHESYLDHMTCCRKPCGWTTIPKRSTIPLARRVGQKRDIPLFSIQKCCPFSRPKPVPCPPMVYYSQGTLLMKSFKIRLKLVGSLTIRTACVERSSPSQP